MRGSKREKAENREKVEVSCVGVERKNKQEKLQDKGLQRAEGHEKRR